MRFLCINVEDDSDRNNQEALEYALVVMRMVIVMRMMIMTCIIEPIDRRYGNSTHRGQTSKGDH